MNHACDINLADLSKCGQPAHGGILITACRHGHSETLPVCQHHADRAWDGGLICTICRRYEQRSAKTFPQVHPMKIAAAPAA